MQNPEMASVSVSGPDQQAEIPREGPASKSCSPPPCWKSTSGEATGRGGRVHRSGAAAHPHGEGQWN